MTEVDASDVIEAYLKVISGPSMGVVRDAAELPYPKEIIGRVLEALMQTCRDDPATQDQIASAYVILADFQSLTESEKSALSIWNSLVKEGASSGSNEKLVKVAQELNSVSETAMAIMSRARSEAEGYLRRAQDIKASTK